MKKINKSHIFSFLLGLIVATTIGVSATILYDAEEVGFTPSNPNWNVNNLEDALNDLYSNKESGGSLVGIYWDFPYSNVEQIFKAPENGTYKIELWGAQGADYDSSLLGGKGGYTAGNLTLNKDEILYLHVGSQPPSTQSNITGGYNGGGNAPSGKDKDGRTGGGATDVRIVSGNWDNFASLKSRIMVAGAGGGAAYEASAAWRSDGGAAGGLNSYIPSDMGSSSANNYGTMASQTSGGKAVSSSSATAKGTFGKGGNGIKTDGGSGGGSGYYGGGGSDMCSGGAGGSSFISGYPGCDAIDGSSTEDNIIHTGQPNHYLRKTFTNMLMIDGKGCDWSTGSATNCGSNQPQPNGTMQAGHSGNGHARITYLG